MQGPSANLLGNRFCLFFFFSKASYLEGAGQVFDCVMVFGRESRQLCSKPPAARGMAIFEKTMLKTELLLRDILFYLAHWTPSPGQFPAPTQANLAPSTLPLTEFTISCSSWVL